MKTKLTNSGSSMRLVVTNTAGDTMTLSVTYSGVRVSMKAKTPAALDSMKRLAKTLVRWVETPRGDTYGQTLAKLDTLAQQSASFDALHAAL